MSDVTITITQELADRSDPSSATNAAPMLALVDAVPGAQLAEFFESDTEDGMFARVYCDQGIRTFQFSYDEISMVILMNAAGVRQVPMTLTLTEVAA